MKRHLPSRKSSQSNQLPTLNQLGNDLINTTPLQKVIALLSPFLCIGLYILSMRLGWWPLAVFSVMMLTFFSYGSTSHDLVHRSLGLPNWFNETMLSVIEILTLRSGHAYRLSHLYHHNCFPHPDDPEGAPARMSAVCALLEGPIYIPRLWVWSWRKAKKGDRIWIFFETLWSVSFVFFALWQWKQMLALLIYAGLVIAGTWVIPFFLVYIQHNASGHNALTQTRAFRGRIIPTVLLQHTYHLEHHLYPMVPAYKWQKLAKRLDPYFQKFGIHPIQIP